MRNVEADSQEAKETKEAEKISKHCILIATSVNSDRTLVASSRKDLVALTPLTGPFFVIFSTQIGASSYGRSS